MAEFLFRATKINRGEDGETPSLDDSPPFELELEARDNSAAIEKGVTEFSSRFPERNFDDYEFGASGPM